jgi:Holliday junction resolvase RusA-like endonuclease
VNPIIIELAGEPRGKGRPRFVRKSGIAFTPSATRKHEAALRYCAQQAMGDRPPLEGALAVSVTAVFPIPVSWSKRKREAALRGELHHTSKPDAENIAKTIDALNQVTWIDDAQIARMEIIKLYGRPRMTIEIRQLDGGAAPEK